MPDNNYTDYVGISRDSMSSAIENSAGGAWVYEYLQCTLYAGPGGVSILNSALKYNNDTVDFNELEINEGSAYIMSVPMPPDYWPFGMVAGTFAIGYIPQAAYGAIEYDGVPSHPDQASNINHWGTYAHQTVALSLWENVSFSYPWGVSFTVNPEKKFEKVVDESLWQYKP